MIWILHDDVLELRFPGRIVGWWRRESGVGGFSLGWDGDGRDGRGVGSLLFRLDVESLIGPFDER